MGRVSPRTGAGDRREEVNMQWSVSAGLPMSFFDNKEVRKTESWPIPRDTRHGGTWCGARHGRCVRVMTGGI